ncbi:MAG: QueT transporter family protein [Bacilli bacterium]|nr:QueT transporter family protein [Bacilli bacterium]
MDKNVTLILRIASNGIVVAIYVVLTVISTPFAYGDIQIRIAEAMVLLCFFRRDFVIGVTLGCLLANVNSTLGPWDILIGTSATLISSLAIAFASPKLLIAVLYPVVANGFIVAFELNWLLQLPFWWCVLTVSIGEWIAVSLGYVFFIVMRYRNKRFFDAIHLNRHLDFSW